VEESIRRHKNNRLLKRNVFKCFLKVCSELQFKTSPGRLFQMKGAEYEYEGAEYEVLKSIKARKSQNFLTPPLFEAQLGNPLEFGDEIWRQKTRVLELPRSEEIMTLAFFFLTQYRLVTDRRTDRRAAIAITRASIASRG